MSANPLKQYFRKPVLYIKLPSGGKFYDSETVIIPPNRELPVFPMTALDDIVCQTPDAVYNGTAVIELLKSCIPNIQDPWKINTVDLDSLLIAIKIASNGELMNLDTKCPSCEEEYSFDVNLVQVLNGIQKTDYTNTLSIGDLNIKFKPLTYLELNEANLRQYEVQKTVNTIMDNYEESVETKNQIQELLNKMNMITNDILSQTIESIITPETVVSDNDHIKEYLLSCDKKSHNLIKTTSISLRENGKIKPLHITCPHCQHEYTHTLNINVTDFFV
jgi:transposase-like protein